ncbi:hypothetical protein CBM2629_B20124 [Cupriavidus taiwanensis]|nr:hypothetical protein CBM2629_B20124 [Cupriavidus taiwanensis]
MAAKVASTRCTTAWCTPLWRARSRTPQLGWRTVKWVNSASAPSRVLSIAERNFEWLMSLYKRQRLLYREMLGLAVTRNNQG